MHIQGLPSILISITPPNILIDTITSILYALALITIVFWNKNDKLYNIFKNKVNIEMDKMEVKEI